MKFVAGIILGFVAFVILERGIRKVKEQLEALRLEVERSTSVAASAVALIKGLADQISANAQNPEGLALLVAHLRENDDTLAAAIKANTPTSVLEPPVAQTDPAV